MANDICSSLTMSRLFRARAEASTAGAACELVAGARAVLSGLSPALSRLSPVGPCCRVSHGCPLRRTPRSFWRRRGPATGTTTGRDTNLPRAKVIDFAAFPERADTRLAGLLLAVPDLVALDLPALARKAGYPATRVIPAVCWLLSLLALKLTATRRVSHVDDLLDDPASALFAGLAILPKKSALTEYSYRLSHDHQRNFLAALDAKMIAAGLADGDEGIFDLDFHAAMHWGTDPALEKHYVPTRSQRARSVLTFFAQDSGTHNLVYANADISKTTQHREVIAFCDHWKSVSGKDPAMLIMDQKVTNQAVLGELDTRGIKFLTLRMRSPALIRHRPASRPTPPSPGGTGGASTSSSANPGSKKLHGNRR
jgi:hypothetical protein